MWHLTFHLLPHSPAWTSSLPVHRAKAGLDSLLPQIDAFEWRNANHRVCSTVETRGGQTME